MAKWLNDRQIYRVGERQANTTVKNVGYCCNTCAAQTHPTEFVITKADIDMGGFDCLFCGESCSILQ